MVGATSRRGRVWGWTLFAPNPTWGQLPWLLMLVAVLTLTLPGCASPPTGKVTATPTLTATPAPYPTATPTPATLRVQQAWGNIHITRLPISMPGNELFNFDHAATPDGQWLIGDVEPRDMLDNTSVTPYVALYNISSRQFRYIHSLLAPQYQVLAASVDGDWLVWSENTPNQSSSDWAIQAYNLNTGASKQLARAPRINGAPVQGAAPQPVVSGGYVIWSEDVATVNPSDAATYKNAEVQLEQLNTGVTTTLATSATGAALSWPWAGWGVITSEGGYSGYILFKNLVTGQSARLNATPDYLVLHGTSAVYSFLPRQLYEVADVSQAVSFQPVYQPTADGSELQEPSVSDRLIAWDSSSGPPIPMVWDRESHVLISLPTTSARNYVAWTGGRLLVWFDPESPAQQAADRQKNLNPLSTICVVDTHALPSNPAA